VTVSVFVKAMRVVGDLDDEFYRDERQRDVWNEAAAVGFQLFVWAGLLAGAVLPWAAGIAGAYAALGVLVLVLVISSTTIGFARQRDVDLHATVTYAKPRLALALVLYALGAVGIVARLLTPTSDSPASMWSGMAVGAVVGVAVAAIAIRGKRRRLARFEAEDD